MAFQNDRGKILKNAYTFRLMGNWALVKDMNLKSNVIKEQSLIPFFAFKKGNYCLCKSIFYVQTT